MEVCVMGQWAALYALPQWKHLRRMHLREYPLCVECMKQGVYTNATVVDHKQPHRGNLHLFLDPGNLQSLCKPHHDNTKRAEEINGMSPGCDVEGNPTDPRHPWNRKAAGAKA
jgi:5-methylcytosine-specific restriction enzyme A